MPEKLLAKYRVYRNKIEIVTLGAAADDIAYWRSQSPAARLRAMELMRQINYGHAAVSGRLKRVLEVAQLTTNSPRKTRKTRK
jgi:hypothetical protein